MRYLITGGAGFVGSHLTDALVARGDEVLVLDDLSTGNVENVADALASGQAELVEGSVCDEELVDECMEWADACFHLASAVGVKLIVQRSVDSLGRSVRGTQVVTEGAHRLGRRLLFASTSEIYGKNGSAALDRAVRPRPGPALDRSLVLLDRARPSARRSSSATTGSAKRTRSSPASSTPWGRGRPAPTGWCCRASSGRPSKGRT